MKKILFTPNGQGSLNAEKSITTRLICRLISSLLLVWNMICLTCEIWSPNVNLCQISGFKWWLRSGQETHVFSETEIVSHSYTCCCQVWQLSIIVGHALHALCSAMDGCYVNEPAYSFCTKADYDNIKFHNERYNKLSCKLQCTVVWNEPEFNLSALYESCPIMSMFISFPNGDLLNNLHGGIAV